MSVDAWDWYSDAGWERQDDAHVVTFTHEEEMDEQMG